MTVRRKRRNASNGTFLAVSCGIAMIVGICVATSIIMFGTA